MDLNVADIIDGIYNDKPADTVAAFNAVIQQKMADAIQARREEIAANLYGTSETDDETDEDSEAEEDLESDDDQELDTEEQEE